MFQAAWTEVRGWVEALADREVAMPILLRLFLAALLATGAVVGSGIVGPYAAVLVAVLAALGYSLVRLRLTGTP